MKLKRSANDVHSFSGTDILVRGLARLEFQEKRTGEEICESRTDLKTRFRSGVLSLARVVRTVNMTISKCQSIRASDTREFQV